MSMFFENPFEKKEQKPNERTFYKPDGTQVIERKEGFGLHVYEKCPDGAFFFRAYNLKDVLIMDYARHRNFEMGHQFDEYGQAIYKFDAVYDEHNVLYEKNEFNFEYYDNGVKKHEHIVSQPSGLVTDMSYNEEGLRIEKYIQRGTVKTFYDENDNPIKREIDRGSGGIITEEL